MLTSRRLHRCLDGNLSVVCADAHCIVGGHTTRECFKAGLCQTCTEDCTLMRIYNRLPLTPDDYTLGAKVLTKDGKMYEVRGCTEDGKMWSLYRRYMCDGTWVIGYSNIPCNELRWV